MIDALRTPDERFANLPDFPWAPRYIDDLPGYEGLRCAVIDEGPKSGAPTFLCLHGEPSWSFLYRRMIPAFLASGARVVAPDLFGFGRSDKPVDDAVYGFHFHRRMLLALVERLDLQDITLVVQDWGGLIGLTLPVEEGFRGRLSRLIVMNTTLATGSPPSPGFLAWRAYAKANPDLEVGALLGRGTPHLTEAECAAYDAPFPDIRYKAGVRAFPERVMTDPGMEGIEESLVAQDFWSKDFKGKVFMAIGEADMVLGPPVMENLRRFLPNCPEPLRIPEAGHFVQEWGGPVAEAALKSFASR
ncbi:haloalkane dehalogenase [Phenylobacterium parvum]|uniref:Haloalkane dehalogenase n=1 Tax=Phenylobacterium parvum TaxID=2201350 RepID=A0A2Z3HSA1_9CAUL|nr:haloalkane dehalogenase [Phenylobacterium parvum]AWM77695.1 haloalkane dehalogenase [Phenylobacterium parvum]